MSDYTKSDNQRVMEGSLAYQPPNERAEDRREALINLHVAEIKLSAEEPVELPRMRIVKAARVSRLSLWLRRLLG